MFSTFKQRLLLGIYVFILLSIPAGAYFISEYQTTVKSSASAPKKDKPPLQVPPKLTIPPAKELLNSSTASAFPSPTPETAPETTIATSFGPTLSFKVSLEGRPAGNQAGKVFVGIAEGTLTANPKFVLNFTVDMPASGAYSGLSLAGLSPGSQYTALIKGAAQIASSIAFTMSPSITNLNDGQPVNLLSGDLNDDNVVSSTDYSIAQKTLGTSQDNADLNKDGIVNTFDLAIIAKNMGQVGASGAWTSPIPSVATPSASLNTPSTPIGGPSPNGDSGYWVWIPKLSN